MDEHIEQLLPFYLNGTLAEDQRMVCERHLLGCTACRTAFIEWQRITAEVLKEANVRARAPRSLSPVVMANLRRRPSLIRSIYSTITLIWAQRAVMVHSGVIPAISLAILISVLATLFLQKPDSFSIALPMFILVPFVAIITVAFLYNPENDLAFEVVFTTPTSAAIVSFARLTLVFAILVGLAFLGSIILVGSGYGGLWTLVRAWLGPMLLLSALTTALGLIWIPAGAEGVSLSLWAGLVILLISELQGYSILNISLRELLYPSWVTFGVQIIVAGLLWMISWLILSREILSVHRLEVRE